MDETRFHDTRRAINPLPCVFEKALLAGCARCGLAARRAIAERETIGCRSASAHGGCAQLLDHLMRNAQFALRLQSLDAPLPHAKLIKLQCGGLLGLQRCADESDTVTDVHTLVFDARRRYGSLEALPSSRIMQSVAAFEIRRRRGRDRHDA